MQAKLILRLWLSEFSKFGHICDFGGIVETRYFASVYRWILDARYRVSTNTVNQALGIASLQIV